MLGGRDSPSFVDAIIRVFNEDSMLGLLDRLTLVVDLRLLDEF